MGENIIELVKFKENDHFGYVVRSLPNYNLCFKQFEANLFDDHYVLVDGLGFRVLGVEHNVEEADKRLYGVAKKCAEEMVKNNNIEGIVDKTGNKA